MLECSSLDVAVEHERWAADVPLYSSADSSPAGTDSRRASDTSLSCANWDIAAQFDACHEQSSLAQMLGLNDDGTDQECLVPPGTPPSQDDHAREWDPEQVLREQLARLGLLQVDIENIVEESLRR